LSRTSYYKLIYFGMVLGGGGVVAWLIYKYHQQLGIGGILLLVALMLLPGQILAFFWRDLLQGFRLLRERRFADSKRHSEAFLRDLERRPWLRHFIWLGFGTYSRSPLCFALNNLGAAEIELGESDNARLHLVAAMQADENCALPYYNMGVLEGSLGQHEEARKWYEQAASLGFSRSTIDAIIQSSTARLARSAGDSSKPI